MDKAKSRKRWLALMLALTLLVQMQGMLRLTATGQETGQTQTQTQAVEVFLSLILEALQNEEIQSLMAYKEVQDLAEYMAEEAVRLAAEDPELMRKILFALDVDEQYTDEITLLVEHMDEITEALQELAATEEGQTAAELFLMVAEDEKARAQMTDFCIMLLQTAQEQDGEGQ